MPKKECSKCGLKTIGIIPICYRCDKKIYHKEYYKRNQDIFKAKALLQHKQNREERLKYMKQYAKDNPEKIKEIAQRFHQKNRESQLKKFSKRYYNNREEELKKQYQYRKNRLKNDKEYATKERLSSRIRMAILNHKGKKTSSSIELLGAPINIVRKHIENQFKEDMCWGNWGNKTSKINGYDNYWEVDHIVPCDAFDLTDVKQQKICFYYKNLQPLWYIENNHKKNKLNWRNKNDKGRINKR